MRQPSSRCLVERNRVMHSCVILASLHAAASGCDASHHDCDDQDIEVEVESSCKYHVLDQTIDIHHPSIFQADIEKQCLYAWNGEDHLRICEKCASEHRPCEDQYTACGGCHCATWDGSLKVNEVHSCKEIKSYFNTKNSKTVECSNATNEEVSSGTIDVQVQHHEPSPEMQNVLLQGIIRGGCTANLDKVYCQKTPTILAFDCTGCNMGVPGLLSKCCDKCLEWKSGLDKDALIGDDVKAFGWCQGCDATYVQAPGSAYKHPWPHADKYAGATNKKALTAMDLFVDTEICSKLNHKCDAASSKEDDQCLQHGEYGEYPCHGGGGRRLEASDRDTTCVEVDDYRRVAEETTTTTTEFTQADGAAGSAITLSVSLVAVSISLLKV